MAKPNNSGNNPVSVVGSQFSCPQPLDLIISGDVVTDTKGNRMFQAQTPFLGFHNKRILLDSDGSPILTMKMKVTSKHDRWQVFRGGKSSNDPDDMIFTVKRPSAVQLKTRVDVFLRKNRTQEDTCDFTVKGRFMKRACLIYVGDSERIIAQVHEGDKKLMVTVYPKVDYAFIVTLIFIFDLINMGGGSTGLVDK